MDKDWIVPDWLAPKSVKALITTRAGGVSAGPYASLNLGFSTDDDPYAVRANRERLRASLPAEPRWLKQVHGTRVITADDPFDDRPEADASITRKAGTVCAIQIADCLPVLLANRAGTVVGAAHAGWRGLAGGVIENVVAAMTQDGGRAGDLIAYIGPGIGPRAFEVGEDVLRAFTARDPDTAGAFVPHAPGKWLADLFALARRALEQAGVTQIQGENLCTYSNPERFYSYRRDKVTGRMAALIWRE